MLGAIRLSLKRDFARLGAALDALTPEQRERIAGGMARFSDLLSRLRPTCEAIGEDIAAALGPEDGRQLGRAMKDTGVSLVFILAKACAFGDVDEAGAVFSKKVGEAIADLPIATAATFRPLLSPWEG